MVHIIIKPSGRKKLKYSDFESGYHNSEVSNWKLRDSEKALKDYTQGASTEEKREIFNDFYKKSEGQK